MSSAPGSIRRRPVRDAVLSILGGEGKTIDMIESQKGRTYKGDESQQEYRDTPKWHNRQELLTLVAEKLKIHPSLWGPKRTSSDFYNIVDSEIEKMRKNRTLIDWNSSGGFGIWRLAAGVKIPESVMSMDVNAPIHDPVQHAETSEDEMRRVFLSILSKGKKDNTYKFTLAKSLLDYCKETIDGGRRTHVIPYEYFSGKFLRYYWYQEYKFRMKQDFHVRGSPKVLQAIRGIFGENPPADFDLLDEGDIRKAKRKILSTVFGHARSKTSLVIPRFQKIPVGNNTEEFRVFYDYDDDKKKLYLKPEAYDFLCRNHGILSRAVLAEWARFLEKVNDRLPRLVAKIDHDSMVRGPLTEYREMYSKYEDHCFYCMNRLEREYTHVDHFIPWSYIFEDSAWNMVLACQECNCRKSNSLPQEEFRDKLIGRNWQYHDEIRGLQVSLQQLDTGKGWEPEIINHYENCREYGFGRIKLP